MKQTSKSRLLPPGFPWLDDEHSRARWMYCIGILYLLVGYLGTNELAALNPWQRPPLPIATQFDAALPFVAWTTVFYVTYYPLLATPLFLAPSAGALSRLTVAQALMNTFAYVIFLLFPTRIDRPPSAHADGIWQTALESLYRADHPYNTFPSLHVAQTCLLALFFMNYSAKSVDFATVTRSTYWPRTVFVFHGVMSLLVAASALLIKQHYIADAMSGALLAAAAAGLLFRNGQPLSKAGAL